MSILLVDDSKTIVHVMTKMLNELGYTEIKKAHNCDEAKLKISASNDEIELIISDWNMPGESGLDLLRYIRGNKATARIPFILLTSDQDRSKIFQAKQYNPQFYLLKPCKKLFLAERLAILAKTHGIQQPLVDGKPLSSDTTGIGEHAVAAVPDGSYSSEEGTHTTSEEIAKVLKQCVFVLSGRKNAEEFRRFLGNEIFGIAPEEVKIQHVHELSSSLHTILQQMLYSIFEE